MANNKSKTIYKESEYISIYTLVPENSLKISEKFNDMIRHEMSQSTSQVNKLPVFAVTSNLSTLSRLNYLIPHLKEHPDYNIAITFKKNQECSNINYDIVLVDDKCDIVLMDCTGVSESMINIDPGLKMLLMMPNMHPWNPTFGFNPLKGMEQFNPMFTGKPMGFGSGLNDNPILRMFGYNGNAGASDETKEDDEKHNEIVNLLKTISTQLESLRQVMCSM